MAFDRTARFASLPALALALLLTACGPSEDDFATAIVTSALQAPKAHELSDDVVDEPCGMLTAERAAVAAASRPTTTLYPESCVDKTADASTVHVTFDGCTGPFGRLKLDGGVDARFEVMDECRLRADLHDTGLTGNGRPLEYQASADIVVLDGAHEIAWNAHVSGTTRRGRSIEQVSAMQVVLDPATGCRTLTGNADGNVDGFEYDWGVTGMSVCPAECPSSGVVKAAWHRGRRDRNFRVEFDGSSVAHVTLPNGDTRDIAMVCAAAEAAESE
jgi:hypothetical protein